MPYWGANVKHDNYVVQAKLHGEETYPAPDELIEYVSNLAKSTEVEETQLAKFFADKIAIAFVDHPLALWVTVDILTTDGRSYGDMRIIKELVE